MDKQVVRSLIHDSEWIRRHKHILLVGPTGIGKTLLAPAFGQKASREGFTAYFATAAQLFRELELARADGSYTKRLRDERYLTTSTLLTSQLPVAKWHAQIGGHILRIFRTASRAFRVERAGFLSGKQPPLREAAPLRFSVVRDHDTLRRVH